MKHRHLFEVGILLILSLVPFLWLSPGEMFLGHDSGTRLNGLEYLRDLFFSWNTTINFGKDWSLYKGFLVTKLPEILLVTITGSYTLGQQLAAMWWMFAMGVSMYIAIRILFPASQTVMRLWASSLYMYNFFVLQAWWIFERAKFSTYAALPLVFAFLYKGLMQEYSLWKSALLIAITLFFGNGGGSPPLYGALLITCLVTFIVCTGYRFHKQGISAVRYSITLSVAIASAWLLFNAYWIVPEIYLFATSYASTLADMGGTASIIAWEAMVVKNASYLNIVRLQGFPEWYDNPSHPYANAFLANPILIVASFIPLALTLVASYFTVRKRSYKLILLVLLILLPIGIFLTAGSHPPLGFLFTLLLKHVPGFAVFRSSFFKFMPAVILPMAILSAYGLAQLLSMIRHTSIRTGLACIACIALIAYHYPFFRSTSFTWIPPFTTKITVPSYVHQTISYLNTHSSPTDRIFLLPTFGSSFHQDSYEWGYWSLTPLFRNGISRPIVANDTNNPPSVVAGMHKAINAKDETGFIRLAQIAGIRYILWRDDLFYHDRIKTSTTFVAIKQTLDAFSLVKPEASFGKWHLYSIPSPAPHVTTNTTATHVVDSSYDLLSAITVAPEGTIIIEPENVSIPTSVVTHQFIRAECIFCLPKDYEALKQGVRPVPARFAPTHPLYPAVMLKEYLTLKKSYTPQALLDVHLAFFLRRKAEGRSTDTHAAAIWNEFQTLTGLTKYKYAVRLYYTGLFQKELQSIIVPASDETHERLIVSLPENDTYTLRVAHTPAPTIFLNGDEIKTGQSVTLSKGIHRIEVLLAKREDASILPAIYLERVVGTRESVPIQLNISRKTNTLTTISLPATDGPALVILNEHFSPQWKLTGPDSAQKAHHIQVYGYANAWIIPKLDKPTTFTITYFPQQIFYIGLGITVISLLAITSLHVHAILAHRQET